MQGSRVLERPPHLVTAALGALAVGVLLLVVARPSVTGLSLPFPGPEGQARAEHAYGELPLAFERDAGRSGPDVDFLARTPAGITAIGPQGATLAVGGPKQPEALGLELANGAAAVKAQALERLPGEVNYLVGQRSEWKTEIATFERVRYADVYPGISLDWRGNQEQLEYDFRLAPGADPARIALGLNGAERVRLAPSGDLVIDVGKASVHQRAPVAYQSIAGQRVEVESAFTLRGETVGFELGAYDRSRPLVIDPLVLAYSTYLGGDAGDFGFAIAVDGGGAAYVTGGTDSTDFDNVGRIEGNSAGADAFVAKLTPAGNALSYSTYLGGAADDTGRAIAVDGAGAAYITGSTDSTDFNIVGQIEGDSTGTDAFVAKLTPAGSGLTYSTYLGGNGADGGAGIAIDTTGAAYVTGFTDSTEFNTVGQIEADSAGSDAFVSKLAPAGSPLVYSTYLGGDGSDNSNAIAVDAAGAAYVTGSTTSTDFNTVGPIEGNSADFDAFVSKLVPAGGELAYSTYLGGDGLDFGRAIATDAAGAAYVAGTTGSTEFNTVGQIEDDSAATDAFVAKLIPAGSALAYSTYLGGNNSDRADALAVDAAGAAYVAGATVSTDFNTVGQIEGGSAGSDAYVSKLTPAGNALAYSTYLGGDAAEPVNGIAVDAAGAAYVTGSTDSINFDIVGQFEGNSAADDAFISKLSFDADGDGVPDDADVCLDEAGPSSNAGCPAPVVPPQEPPVTKADRTISLATSKSKVTKGKKVRLSGQIAATAGETACEAGQAVDLQRVKTGSAFTSFASETTDAAGTYSLKVRVRKTFRYRAALDETTACEAGLSGVEKVKAKRRRRR